MFFCCSPSPLQKLPIVVIQKFCYHGNVTSHFSSLLFALLLCAQTFITKFCSTLGQGRGEEGKKEFKSSSLPNTLTMSVALINKTWHQLNLTWWNENYMLVKVTINDSFFLQSFKVHFVKRFYLRLCLFGISSSFFLACLRYCYLSYADVCSLSIS